MTRLEGSKMLNPENDLKISNNINILEGFEIFERHRRNGFSAALPAVSLSMVAGEDENISSDCLLYYNIRSNITRKINKLHRGTLEKKEVKKMRTYFLHPIYRDITSIGDIPGGETLGGEINAQDE